MNEISVDPKRSRPLLALALSVTLLAACGDKPPEAAPPAPPAPSAAPVSAAPAPPAAQELKFEEFSGHYLSNKSGVSADQAFFAFTEAEAFQKVFPRAPPVGAPKPAVSKEAFGTKLVVATVKRGASIVTYKVEKVTLDQGVVTVAYTATDPGTKGSATFATPLILTIDKGAYTSIAFVENGKPVGNAKP